MNDSIGEVIPGREHSEICYAIDEPFYSGHQCMSPATQRAIRQSTEQMSEAPNNGDSVLNEAQKLIFGQREKEYGSATKNFTRVAGLWSSYLSIDLSPHDVCMLMVLLKCARAKEGIDTAGEPQRDSLVDIAGYTGCSEKVTNGL